MGKLKFYTINKNYLDYLRENGDSKVPKQLLEVMDINKYPNVKARALIRKELKWCKDHSSDIKNLASKVYKWGANRNSPLSKNCCDFKRLEQAHDIYIRDFL